MIDIGTDEFGHSVRMLIAKALRSYESSALKCFLEDKNIIVRSAAARELQIRGEPETLRVAESLLISPKVACREIGAFILGQLGTPNRPFQVESTKLLKSALEKEKNTEVIVAIVISLGKQMDASVMSALLKYKHNKFAKIRASVAFAIGCVGSDNAVVRPTVRKVLGDMAQDKSSAVREYVALAYTLLGDSD